MFHDKTWIKMSKWTIFVFLKYDFSENISLLYFHTEIIWRSIWRNNRQSIFDVLGRLPWSKKRIFYQGDKKQLFLKKKVNHRSRPLGHWDQSALYFQEAQTSNSNIKWTLIQHTSRLVWLFSFGWEHFFA